MASKEGPSDAVPNVPGVPDSTEQPPSYSYNPHFPPPQPHYAPPAGQHAYGPQPGGHNTHAPMMINQPIVNQPTQQTSNNVVVINAGGGGEDDRGYPQNVKGWSSGLFGCCSDMSTCCCGLFCYECLVCRIACKMDEYCCIPYCVPGGVIAMRTKMRTQFGIRGSICEDCVTMYYCPALAVCQMARELKHHGY